MFTKATKTESRLRLAISGPSGAGKTYSALRIARGLGQKIALIDTEHGSASKYADLFDFDICELQNFSPSHYVEAIQMAGRAGYETLIIDSLSHAWFWSLNEANNSKNSFTGWGRIRPLERALIDAILGSPQHVIATMRTKTEYVLRDQNGRTVPEKVGTAPIQASGIEYEFDIAGDLDLSHMLTISKSRCPELSGTTHLNPGENLGKVALEWLKGAPPAPPVESPQAKAERVKTAREAMGLTTDEVRNLMEDYFGGATTPAMLSSDQVDELIRIINGEDGTEIL